MSIIKIIGYLVAIVGIIVLAVGVMPPLRAILKFIPAAITNMDILIGGLVIAVIGIFMAFKTGTSRQKAVEVPIYHGKEVVGFRRLGKK